MDRLIKTIENRRVVLYTAACFIVLIITLISALIAENYENSRSQREAVKYQLALAGRLSEYGIADDDIADMILSRNTDADISKGEKILSSYGMRSKSTTGGEFVCRSGFSGIVVSACGCILTFAVGMLILCGIYSEIRKIGKHTEENLPIQNSDDRDIFLLIESICRIMSNTEHLVRQISSEKEYLITYLQDFSHQIKTPCTGLILNNDIMLSTPMDYDEQREFLEGNKSCLMRIEKLCTESLKLARLNADAVEYKYDDFSVKKFCNDIRLQLQSLAKSRGNEIICDVGDDIRLYCDEKWISEAISNLVKNSAEHTENGIIKIHAEENPISVNIIIEDNGSGISAEDLPYIFRRFHSRSAEKNPLSTGIGMAIAKKICEDMGGKMYIDSEPDKGTKIMLEFLKNIKHEFGRIKN